MIDFWGKHRDCEQQLKAWIQEATKAEWTNPNEIKVDHPSASIIGNDRDVFNIKGNSYRLFVRRKLSLEMIHQIHKEWHISTEVWVPAY